MRRWVARNRRYQLMFSALRPKARGFAGSLGEEATGPGVLPAHPSGSQEVKFKSKPALGLGTPGADIFEDDWRAGGWEPLPDHSTEVIRPTAPAFNADRWPFRKVQGCAHVRISVVQKEKRRADTPSRHPRRLGRPVQDPDQNQAMSPRACRSPLKGSAGPGEEAGTDFL